MKLRIRGNSLRLRVSGEVSVEGGRPIGGGKELQILVQKDEARPGRADDSVA